MMLLRAVPANAAPSPPFTQCPLIGEDTSCSVLIVVNAGGSHSVYTDPSQGPYDGADDTLIGVLNNSGAVVSSVPLTGSEIFAFDEDGLCTTTNAPSGCPFGPSGYEGPGTSFTVTDLNTGSVTFAGGLQPGASAYFSLEGPASSIGGAESVVDLGTLDLNGYCRSIGFTESKLSKPQIGPNYAYENWTCVGQDQSPQLIDMGSACEWQYSDRPVAAFPNDQNDAYSWHCFTAPPCSTATTTEPGLPNFAAQVCQLTAAETTIAQQVGKLLSVVGMFPHVSPLNASTYTGAAIAVIPGSAADIAGATKVYIRAALKTFKDIVTEIIQGGVADALGIPNVVQDLAGVISEDVSAAQSDAAAAQAMQNSNGQMTATSTAEVVTNATDAALHLVNKLDHLRKVLEEYKRALQARTQTVVIVVVMVELEYDITILTQEENNLSADLKAIGLVPQGGYDMLPGLPTHHFVPGSGFTLVQDQLDYNHPSNLLQSQYLPIGLSPGDRVVAPTIASETTSAQSLLGGGSLVVSASGFGSQAPIEIALSSPACPICGALTATGSTAASSNRRRHRRKPRHAAPRRLAIVRADAAGRFSAHVRIPAKATPGRYELYVIGRGSGGRPRLLEKTIRVRSRRHRCHSHHRCKKH
jgi:hypothetical protein